MGVNKFSASRYAHYVATVIYRPFSQFLYVAVGVFASFSIFDWLFLGQDALDIINARLLFSLGCFLLLRYVELHKSMLLSLAECLMMLVANGLVIWFSLTNMALGQSDAHIGLLLMMLYIASFSRLPLLPASINLLTILVGYLVFILPKLNQLHADGGASATLTLVACCMLCICACIRRELETRRSYQQYRQLRRQKMELVASTSNLKTLSELDPLTQLNNRQHLDSVVRPTLVFWQNIGVIMLDIDFFKRINDNFGHAQGDEVIRNVAAIIRRHVALYDAQHLRHTKHTSSAIRYGGEEFLVLVPNTSHLAVWELAEAIRETVEAQCLIHNGQLRFPTTISIGCTWTKDTRQPIEKVIAFADTALYMSKQNGRNATTVV